MDIQEETLNPYEEKQGRKRDRLNRASENARKRSEAGFRRSDQILGPIPMGQPILVGHHSEKRHRNALRKADNAMRRGVDEEKNAKELARRAASVGSGGISSDDPDAVPKLQARVAELEELRDRKKAINKAYVVIRRGGKDKDAALAGLPNLSDAAKATLARNMASQSWVDKPFPPYVFSNLSGNIRRLKLRIEELKKVNFDADPEVLLERDGWKIETRPDLNRVAFDFPGKPNKEVRKLLKEAGFKWMPSEGLWTRHLSSGIWWAKDFVAPKIPQDWRA